MAQQERENFYRFATLMMDHTKKSFKDLLELHLMKNHLSFEEFLNQNQHELFHLCYFKCRCNCQCINSYILPRNRVLNKSQLDILFDKHGPKLPCHIQKQNAEFCCSKAKSGISTDVLDVTMANCLLTHFCADVFWHCCLTLPRLSLEDFLNDNKHDIYHLVVGINNICGHCPNGYTLPKKQLINQHYFACLFNKTTQLCSSCSSSSSISTVCEVKATSGVSVGSIDCIIANMLLQSLCPLRKAVDTLVNLRNKMYGHVPEAKMSNQDYKNCMSEVEKNLIDIAVVCQKETETKQALEDLRQRPLDETLLIKYQTVLLTDIKAENDIQRDIKECLDTNLSIQQRLTSLKHLQAAKMQDVLSAIDKFDKQNTKDIDRRTKRCKELSLLTSAAVKIHSEEATFVQTSAIPAILKSLNEMGCVLITGPPGSGKSRFAMETLFRYCDQNNHYTMVNLPNISDWHDVININDNCIVLCDDIFGKTNSFYNEDIHSKYVEAVYTCVKTGHVKVILTMRDNIKRRCSTVISKHRLLCNDTFVDLSSAKFQMSHVEKRKCLLNYLKKYGVHETSDRQEENYDTASYNLKETSFIHSSTINCIIENKSNSIIDFPQICYMFTSNRAFLKQGLAFFKHANKILCENITDMKKKQSTDECHFNRMDFTILTSVLLNWDRIDVENLNLEQIKNVSLSIFGQQENLLTRHGVIESVNRLLNGNYLKKDRNIYCFQHRTILEAVFLSCHGIDTASMVQMMDFPFIVEMTRPEDYSELEGEIIYKVSEQYYTLLAQQLLCHLCNDYTDNPYDFAKTASESPIIQLTDTKIIDSLCNMFRQKEHFKCFSRSMYIYSLPLPTFSENSLLQLALTDSFHLSTALLIYCKTDDTILDYLQSDICKTLSFDNESAVLCTECIKISFLCFCRILNETKARVAWNIIKLHNIRLEDIPGFVDNGLVEIFRNTSSIELLCRVIDDPMSTLLNVDGFLGFLFDKDFKMENLKLLLNAFDRNIFTKLLWMEAACKINDMELIKCFCEHFTFSTIDMVLTIKEACIKGDKELLKYLTVTYAAENKELLDYIWELTSVLGSPFFIMFIKVYFQIYGAGLFNMTDVMSWAYSNPDKDFISCVLDNVDYSLLDMNSIMKVACDNEYFDIVSFFMYLLSSIDPNLFELNPVIDFACKRNNKDILKTILRKCDPKLININKIVVWTCSQNDVEFLEFLLETVGDDTFYTHSSAINYALELVCRNGCLESTKLLFKKVSQNSLDVSKAFRMALESNNKDLVMFLLETCEQKYIDLNSIIRESISSIEDVGCFKVLFQGIYDFSLSTENLIRIIENAFENNNDEIIMIIVENAEHDDINSLFQWSCERGDLSFTKLLLEKLDLALVDFTSAMRVACCSQTCNVDIVKLLVKSCENPPLDFKKTMTKACSMGNFDLVRFLLDTFDCNVFDMKSVFNWTCAKGNYQHVNHLLLNFDQELFDFKCALNNACTTGNEDVVILLVGIKEPSFFDYNSAIEDACANGYLQIVKIILERYDHTCFDMSSLFMSACHANNLKVVEILIEKGYTRLWKDIKIMKKKSQNAELISILCNFSFRKK